MNHKVVYKGPTKRYFSIFGLLFGGAGGKHSGRCEGNCSKCPDHFGYRYGRWYYGKYHSHGCEFGGNKNSGE